LTSAETTVRAAIYEVIAATAHLTGMRLDLSVVLIDALVQRIRNGPDHWAFVALAAPCAAGILKNVEIDGRPAISIDREEEP
jgi:hypothetical protein